MCAGQDYDDRVLPSIGNEVLKAAVAQFDPEQLITQRDVVFVSILLLTPPPPRSQRELRLIFQRGQRNSTLLYFIANTFYRLSSRMSRSLI